MQGVNAIAIASVKHDISNFSSCFNKMDGAIASIKYHRLNLDPTTTTVPAVPQAGANALHTPAVPQAGAEPTINQSPPCLQASTESTPHIARRDSDMATYQHASPIPKWLQEPSGVDFPYRAWARMKNKDPASAQVRNAPVIAAVSTSWGHSCTVGSVVNQCNISASLRLGVQLSLIELKMRSKASETGWEADLTIDPTYLKSITFKTGNTEDKAFGELYNKAILADVSPGTTDEWRAISTADHQPLSALAGRRFIRITMTFDRDNLKASRYAAYRRDVGTGLKESDLRGPMADFAETMALRASSLELFIVPTKTLEPQYLDCINFFDALMALRTSMVPTGVRPGCSLMAARHVRFDHQGRACSVLDKIVNNLVDDYMTDPKDAFPEAPPWLLSPTGEFAQALTPGDMSNRMGLAFNPAQFVLLYGSALLAEWENKLEQTMSMYDGHFRWEVEWRRSKGVRNTTLLLRPVGHVTGGRIVASPPTATADVVFDKADNIPGLVDKYQGRVYASNDPDWPVALIVKHTIQRPPKLRCTVRCVPDAGHEAEILKAFSALEKVP
ncbi:hypothetical protein BDV95DRAFT_607797 [Massariosphaeria phaeospora]|uniref:Uncharacterized protein n=1 Tax=Massariosphaeria phaeospora TaxID=100035 RepID=A0A7C8I4I2_9PLEO|nr:hypothetical protein BDV95DRAFT_607797 [Massariosphaeria phaeospora]